MVIEALITHHLVKVLEHQGENFLYRTPFLKEHLRMLTELFHGVTKSQFYDLYLFRV